jgi:hypothetical protein
MIFEPYTMLETSIIATILVACAVTALAIGLR